MTPPDHSYARVLKQSNLRSNGPRTHRTPTGLVSLADYLAYVESCAQAWIAEGREQDAEELRKVGYELVQEIGADNE